MGGEDDVLQGWQNVQWNEERERERESCFWVEKLLKRAIGEREKRCSPERMDFKGTPG